MANAPGKNHRKGLTLPNIIEMFPDDKAAEKWFAEVRWPNGVTCAHCGSDNVQTGAKHPTMPYHCRSCRKYFSVRTGTVMAEFQDRISEMGAGYLPDEYQPEGRFQHEAASGRWSDPEIRLAPGSPYPPDVGKGNQPERERRRGRRSVLRRQGEEQAPGE